MLDSEVSEAFHISHCGSRWDLFVQPVLYASAEQSKLYVVSVVKRPHPQMSAVLLHEIPVLVAILLRLDLDILAFSARRNAILSLLASSHRLLGGCDDD